LWGDPELPVFARPLAAPADPPISIAWDAPDRLKISLPAKPFGQQIAEQYAVRLFPGSETAAMVREAPHGSLRMLTPVHFFRLPLPKGFVAAGYATLKRPEDNSHRAVFRVDPADRFLYVLYFPKKESPGETFALQFVNPRPVGSVSADGAPAARSPLQ
jgi:hypothetical protein